jgi:hypothetical protein
VADRARDDEELREGRRLKRGGQHAEARSHFEAALALDRSAWRVECEAGFVAWRAEDFEAADRHVRGAMNGIPLASFPKRSGCPPRCASSTRASSPRRARGPTTLAICGRRRCA